MSQNGTGVRQNEQPAGGNDKYWNFACLGAAFILAFLVLAVILPSVGGMISNPPPHLRMWQVGRFSFFPIPFFTSVGMVGAGLALTAFGTFRQNICQSAGLFLLGLLFVCSLFCVS
jgi:hypothetical protein